MANERPQDIKRAANSPVSRPAVDPPASNPVAPPSAISPPSSQGTPVAAPTNVRARMEEIESYLASRGWELMGMNEKGQSIWADPKGKTDRSPTQVTRVKLPVAGGGTEVVPQWRHPPTSWVYPIDEAMLIQRTRDGEIAAVPA